MNSRAPLNPNPRRGMAHHLAKLTDADIPLIRQLHADGLSCRTIAAKFDVSKHAIYQVVRYISWRHVR